MTTRIHDEQLRLHALPGKDVDSLPAIADLRRLADRRASEKSFSKKSFSGPLLIATLFVIAGAYR